MKYSLCLLGALWLLGVPALATERLIYHDIRTDAKGQIIPWFDDEPGKSYDHVVNLVWKFWDEMRTDLNGLPYYMNHQVWRPDFNDSRGLGGDQLQMAMSSWELLYAYSGNERVKENLRFLADYTLTHGMSPTDCLWPNIPFPYNTLVYSGQYDGDMVLGIGFAQPDKAGSFGLEVLTIFKTFNDARFPNATDKRYLVAAIAIADTLAARIQAGDEANSPLPFKVNVRTGDLGTTNNNRPGKAPRQDGYTTNWGGTMELFLELIRLQRGNTAAYQQAFDTLLAWMKKYPMQNNRWGPFFEDVAKYSDTQINAMTWARFIMNHRQFFPEWKTDVQNIIDWVYQTLGNKQWNPYGVIVIDEQTAYRVPANSHTSRQAADELLFASLTGDESRREHAVRQLNWATYMVDDDGKNRFPDDDIWLTDGYGDYVRHYLRAMAAFPELAPTCQSHLLHSTSTIQQIDYQGHVNKFLTPLVRDIPAASVLIAYTTFDRTGTEVMRLTTRPSRVLLNGRVLDVGTGNDAYSWRPLASGGVLTVQRANGRHVIVVQ